MTGAGIFHYSRERFTQAGSRARRAPAGLLRALLLTFRGVLIKSARTRQPPNILVIVGDEA
jgi:hypothetical protein